MTKPDKSFHSTCEEFRKRIHIVLVHPEYGGNVGSIARAIENMGLLGHFRIVGNRETLEWSEVRKMAKHAFERVSQVEFFPDLPAALDVGAPGKTLALATSSRVGSSSRPHPMNVRPAIEKATRKLKLQEITDLVLVFGRESDGLTNEEVDFCDWIITIPSHHTYRSLNLAQSVMVVAHEINECLLGNWAAHQAEKPTQKDKIIQHLLELAEQSGFILPGDPFKMRPRLEEIFSQFPAHIPHAPTLHGLMDQISRSMKKGEPDIKGRYKRVLERS